jgi:hypothetical protein
MCLDVVHSLSDLALNFNPFWVMIHYSDFTSAFSIRDSVIPTVSGYSWKFGEEETFIDVIKYRHFLVLKTAEILHMPVVMKLNVWNQHKKALGCMIHIQIFKP